MGVVESIFKFIYPYKSPNPLARGYKPPVSENWTDDEHKIFNQRSLNLVVNSDYNGEQIDENLPFIRKTFPELTAKELEEYRQYLTKSSKKPVVPQDKTVISKRKFTPPVNGKGIEENFSRFD